MRIRGAARVAAVAVAMAALASCATLNKEECQTVDWLDLGRKDGAEGRPASHIDAHRRACAEHKLPIDQTQWQTGWTEGIRLYCTADNGLLQGREGHSYANSCPPELKSEFESAYFVAKAVYDARLSRDRLAVELETLLSELREAKKPEDRKRIEIAIDERRAQMRRANDRLRDAERDYDRYVFARR